MVDYYTATGSTCGSLDVWPIWTASVSTTAATTVTPQIWTIWTGIVTSAATTSTGIQNEIWRVWNQRVSAAVTYPVRVSPAQRVRPRMRQLSVEEIAAHEEYERVMCAKYDEEKAKRVAAEARAELLLHRLLTLEQRESLKEKNHFYLHSVGKRYRIDRGQTGNVKLVDEKDQVIESYCIHPAGVPDADTMAAQKLMLEADPETFRRVANITHRNGAVTAGTPLRAVV